MERVQVIALAVLLSALALFGAGVLADRHGQRLSDGSRLAGALVDGARGVPLWGSERETRRGARADQPGVPPSEPRRGRRGSDGATVVGAEDDLIPAGGRRTVRLGGGSADEALGGDGLREQLAAARAGTLPRAGGASEPVHHEPEAVDADPPEERQPDAGGVLLSIPLRGSLDPEQGGSPVEADGVVVDRDAADFTEDAQYTLPAGGNVDGAKGNIAVHVEPHWAGSDEINNSLLQIRDEHQWENALAIVKNYNSLRFIIIDSAGVETNVNIYIDTWQPNESHRVTATWGDEQMALYVDGQQVGQSTLPNTLAFRDSTPIHVGSDFPGSQYRGANGRISNLTIYGRPLAQGEIP